MEIFTTLILIAVGIGLIVKGGDIFVESAVWLAKVFKIPNFIIGATIVSIATTLPEVIVSLLAAAEGNTEIAIGNAVGSVTANLGLILSLTFIFTPFIFERHDYLLNALLMTGSIVLLYMLSLSGVLNIWLSFLLFIPLSVFVFASVKNAKNEMRLAPTTNEAQGADKSKKSVIKNTAFFVLGIAGIVGGASLLVTYGSKFAGLMGVSDGIIAVTLVAVGTSLPELVTTLTAIAKKQSELSVGNILGANIIDITLILPLCAAISGSSLTVQQATLYIDFAFCLGIAAVAVAPSLVCGKFMRWQGLLMLTAYAAYITFRVVTT